jgi:Rac GTPase-activating protein 1
MRPHAFVNKTVLKPEMCEPCGKRIKFSKMALKCKDCKATCHPECRDKVPLPCVTASTPSNSKQQMVSVQLIATIKLTDYVCR